MRRYTTLCIIRFITGIIEWYIIILYTIRCITKRIKKTRTLVSGFFYGRRRGVFVRTITLLP
jgi:hypothetical protein